MRYYTGMIKKTKVESLDQWQKTLENEGHQIIKTSFCTKNYYAEIKTNKKLKNGKWNWLKTEVSAWHNSENDNETKTFWIIKYENVYVIGFLKCEKGLCFPYKEFKTLKECVSWLKLKGYKKLIQ